MVGKDPTRLASEVLRVKIVQRCKGTEGWGLVLEEFGPSLGEAGQREKPYRGVHSVAGASAGRCQESAVTGHLSTLPGTSHILVSPIPQGRSPRLIK